VLSEKRRKGLARMKEDACSQEGGGLERSEEGEVKNRTPPKKRKVDMNVRKEQSEEGRGSAN